MNSMKEILNEWKKLTESSQTQFPLHEPSFQAIATWFKSLSGARMMFYDIETIGTTFGNFQSRVPQQISELYAKAFDCPSYFSKEVVETGQLPNANEFHYLADLNPAVQARRNQEQSLTFDQAVAQGLETYAVDAKGRKEYNQPWNVQDYIDYTQREKPEMLAAIQAGAPLTAPEVEMLSNFADFITEELNKGGSKLYICGHNIVKFDNAFILLCAKNYPDIYQKINTVFNDSRVEFLDTLTLAQNINLKITRAMNKFMPGGSEFFGDELDAMDRNKFKKRDEREKTIFYQYKGQTNMRNSMEALSRIFKLVQTAAHTASDDVKVNIEAFAEMSHMSQEINYTISTLANPEDFVPKRTF